MLAFCPLCASDEYTESHRLDDGTRYAVCSDRSHGPEGFVWEPTDSSKIASTRGGGLGTELDIWDKLLACLEPGETFISYGELENRFIERYPTESETLLHRYGHRWRYPSHRSGQFSMSSYLAGRLRDLEKEGSVDLQWGPADGEWSYNEVISYWRLSGGGSGV